MFSKSKMKSFQIFNNKNNNFVIVGYRKIFEVNKCNNQQSYAADVIDKDEMQNRSMN